MTENKKWISKKNAIGLVDESNFDFIEEELPAVDGEILIQNEYLSVDPTQRMWLTDMPGYLPPIQIDEVIRSSGMGRVIQSKSDKFDEGSCQRSCWMADPSDFRWKRIPAEICQFLHD